MYSKSHEVHTGAHSNRRMGGKVLNSGVEIRDQSLIPEELHFEGQVTVGHSTFGQVKEI